MGIDTADNELIMLEVVHHYVEVLDRYFGNVCELDLIFNFHKVRAAAHSACGYLQVVDDCLFLFTVPLDPFECASVTDSLWSKRTCCHQTAESAHGGVIKPSVASAAPSCLEGSGCNCRRTSCWTKCSLGGSCRSPARRRVLCTLASPSKCQQAVLCAAASPLQYVVVRQVYVVLTRFCIAKHAPHMAGHHARHRGARSACGGGQNGHC